jgi:5-oxoprolinase (ATP-hydrolysing)
MALADVVQEAQRPHSQTYSTEARETFQPIFQDLKSEVEAGIKEQGIAKSELDFEHYLNMRYHGTETSIMILAEPDGDFKSEFLKRHLQEFNFNFPEDRPILIDDVRVRGIGRSEATATATNQLSRELSMLNFAKSDCKPSTIKSVFFKNSGSQETPVYILDALSPGSLVAGPAIILDSTQTLVVVPGATAKILTAHVVIEISPLAKQTLSDTVIDPASLSVFGHRFMSIAEQMGRALQNTSVSLNIKERLDFSCAIFGPDAGLVANAPHVPVHLGSMSYAVKYQHETRKGDLVPGDVLVSNHPEAGGTHLPDITVIQPVFDREGKDILFYVASRGHHTDIGGLGGTSMPPNSTEVRTNPDELNECNC